MRPTVFLAGASGVIGRNLVPLLIADGWRVFGTTRSPTKAAEIAAQGAEPVVVDVFDPEALSKAVTNAKPKIVIHQLTDLQPSPSAANLDASRERNARLREVGTCNLVAAAVAAGASRFIAQSISFAYAPGPTPYDESAPLNTGAPGSAGVTARGVASLERQVLCAPFEGLVLRYGRLYGPDTGTDTAPANGPLHVSAAAHAAAIACTRGEPGIYNVAEDDGWVNVNKATGLLGWRP